MEITKLFNSGGIVMYPLLFISIMVMTLAIERLSFWLKIGQRQQPLTRTALDLYQQQSPLVIDRLERDRDLPISRIFLSAIAIKDASPEEFRLAMESEAYQEIPILRRFNNIFDAAIGLAPLFGLLGTILGLINSFSALKIGTGGGSGTSTVVAGISEALVSTASGLIVAILASIFANLFRGLYQRQLAQIQAATSQLELIHRRQWETGRRGATNEGMQFQHLKPKI
jgi:biopolymer transport protein ExbB